MKQTVNLAFALMGILFRVCLTIANILEVKIVSVGSLTMTGGLIVFPISYIINDCVAEVWGYRKARLLIWTGFAANFIAVAFIQLRFGFHLRRFGLNKRLLPLFSDLLPVSFWPVLSLFWWDHLSMHM